MTGFLLVLLYAALAAAGAAFLMWPNRLPTQVVSSIVVNRPIEAVFAYATTPANWPDWHPASRAVRGATDHALRVGEEVEESVALLGRPGTFVWTVAAREEPTLWTITTRRGDVGCDITYRLIAQGGATYFERTMEYWTSGVVLGLIDIAIMRKRNRAESEEALQRLKTRIEAAPVARNSDASA